jgi:signal recognition particle receptor subunit beta
MTTMFSSFGRDFLGNIGLLGSGGSGKTRALYEIERELSDQVLFPYDEEKEMLGTTTVVDHTIKLGSWKFRIWDNPGQDSFGVVRAAVSKTLNYKGLILFLDGSCSIYDFVAFGHALAIRKFMTEDVIPCVVIQNKTDLEGLLRNLSKKIAKTVSDEASRLYGGLYVPYKNRLAKKRAFFNLEVTTQEEADYTTFSMLEQALVNSFDLFAYEQFGSELEATQSGLTMLNRRLIIRAMLISFCNDIVAHQLGNLIPALHRISDKAVVASNYYRPTARETGSTKHIWGKSPEPLFPIRLYTDEGPFSFFDANYVENLLLDILGPEEKFTKHVNVLQGFLEAHNMELVASVRANATTSKGVIKMLSGIGALIERIREPWDSIGSEADKEEDGDQEFFDIKGF